MKLTLFRSGPGHVASFRPPRCQRHAVVGVLLLSVFGSAVSAAAQPSRTQALLEARQSKAKSLQPHQPGRVEKWLVKLENDRVLERLFQGSDKGFYPKFGTIASGSSLGFGGGYRNRTLMARRATLDTWGSYTLKKYWMLHAELDMPRLAGGLVSAELHASKSDFGRLDFFGLGADSRRADRTNFTLRNTVLGGTAGVHVTPWLTAGGGLEYLAPRVGSGKSPRIPTVETLFDPADVPGFTEQPDFLHYQAFVDLNYREPRGNPRRGGWYQVRYHAYKDQDLDRYSFDRVDVDLQQYFPFLNDRRVIALHALVSTSTVDAGQVYPFYLQPTLGGSRSLRGFRSYRFRGEHLLLLQAEYRFEIFPALDAALFYDAGKVTRLRSDLDLDGLEHDYGIGFRFGTLQGVFMRIEAAFGSTDGKHFRIRFQNVF
jgi:hypothetical protein